MCWPTATPARRWSAIWAPEAKIVAERRLWLAVLRAQAELGVPVPDEAIADYERVLDDVDLASDRGP